MTDENLPLPQPARFTLNSTTLVINDGKHTVTIYGDLTVFGTTTSTTTIDAETKDPFIKLAVGNLTDLQDFGIEGVYQIDGVDNYGIIYRQASTGRWRIVTTATEPTGLTVTGGTLVDFEAKNLYGTLATAAQPNITSLAPAYTGYLYATAGALAASTTIPYTAITGIAAAAPITYSGGSIGFNYSLASDLKLNNNQLYLKAGDNSNHYLEYSNEPGSDGPILQGFATVGFKINGTTRIQILEPGIYMPYQTPNSYLYLNGSGIVISQPAATWVNDVLSLFAAGSGIGLASGVISVNSLSAFSTDDVKEGKTNLYYTASRFNTAFATKTTSDLTEGSNLYYTNARARAAISGSENITYNNTTGALDTIQRIVPTASVQFARTFLDATSIDAHTIFQMTNGLNGFNNYIYIYKTRAGGLNTFENIMQQVHYGSNSTNTPYPAFSWYTYNNIATAGGELATTVFESMQDGTTAPVLGFVGKSVQLPRTTASTILCVDVNSYIQSVALSASLLFSGGTLSTVQDIRTSATPTFTGMLLTGLTALTYLYADGSKNITSRSASNFTSDVRAQLSAGNSMTYASGVFDTIQDIRTSASLTFNALILNSLTASTYLYADTSKNISSRSAGQFTADVRAQLSAGNSLTYASGVFDTIQDIRTSASPSFVGANLSSLTATTYLYADSLKNITSRSSVNFTTDVRSQFIAGSGIGISSGTISVNSLSAFSTDDVKEGKTNLYFTVARARDSFSSSTNVIIQAGGVLETAQGITTGATPSFAGLQLTTAAGIELISEGTPDSFLVQNLGSTLSLECNKVTDGDSSILADPKPSANGNSFVRCFTRTDVGTGSADFDIYKADGAGTTIQHHFPANRSDVSYVCADNGSFAVGGTTTSGYLMNVHGSLNVGSLYVDGSSASVATSGTFTFTFGTPSDFSGYANSYGSYTRIGNVVNFSGRFTANIDSAIVAGSAVSLVTNFPVPLSGAWPGPYSVWGTFNVYSDILALPKMTQNHISINTTVFPTNAIAYLITFPVDTIAGQPYIFYYNLSYIVS